MANQLSNELLAQLFQQESNDPFLTLITLNHSSFAQPKRLVNNSENITSRGNTFSAFPVTIKLPSDDGETAKEVSIEFDNVSLELVEEIRTVVSGEKIDVKLEMILASLPDQVQMSVEELFIQTVTYTSSRISAKLGMDSFLNTEVTSERYTPKNFPGLF